MSRVGSSNLSTCITRDFKSVVSQDCPQEVVETAIYPRINGYAFGELSTHKRLRFPRNPRINGYAFTHKRLRLFGSRPEDARPGGLSPVSTYISNNPVLRTRPLLGYAYKENNS